MSEEATGQNWLYAPMEPTKWENEECGGAVRWRQGDGLLEQLWIVSEYSGCNQTGRREEWRIVPIV